MAPLGPVAVKIVMGLLGGVEGTVAKIPWLCRLVGGVEMVMGGVEGMVVGGVEGVVAKRLCPHHLMGGGRMSKVHYLMGGVTMSEVV